MNTGKSKHIVAALIGAAALLGVAGNAAAQAGFANELSVFAAWDDVDKPEKIEALTLNLRYGRFVSERMVATATLSRSSFEASGVDTSTTSVLGGIRYYFGELRQQAFVPFGEAAIGFANTDTGRNDGTDLTWEFGAGVALMLSERTSVDGSFRFYNTDTDARTKGSRFFLGLTTRF